ncbi:hypothetical protein C0J52_09207 [Blattella germanica]|nr:hypothetical protein C0J52_09207 [Blattella germanica]
MSQEPPKDDFTNPAALVPVAPQNQQTQNGTLTVNLGICRICHGGASSIHVGPLAAPCACKGTVEKVHVSCLERWLTESGADVCELCGYRYQVVRIPRQNIAASFVTWVSTDMDAKQMVLDLLWFCVMTPLAVFAGYLVLMSTRVLMNLKLEDNPWVMVTLLMTSSLTLVAYYGWLAPEDVLRDERPRADLLINKASRRWQ